MKLAGRRYTVSRNYQEAAKGAADRAAIVAPLYRRHRDVTDRARGAADPISPSKMWYQGAYASRIAVADQLFSKSQHFPIWGRREQHGRRIWPGNARRPVADVKLHHISYDIWTCFHNWTRDYFGNLSRGRPVLVREASIG